MFYKNKHITQPLIIFKQQYQVHWGVGLNTGIPNSKCMGVPFFFSYTSAWNTGRVFKFILKFLHKN